MSNVHICPVCRGTGLVPEGFYNPFYYPGGSTTALMQEKCRACENGVIIVKDDRYRPCYNLLRTEPGYYVRWMDNPVHWQDTSTIPWWYAHTHGICW